MEEPLLQDKRQEHNRFCHYANELIEKIIGKPQTTNVDASLDRIRRVCVKIFFKIFLLNATFLLHNKHLTQFDKLVMTSCCGHLWHNIKFRGCCVEG